MDKTVIFWFYDKHELESSDGIDLEEISIPFWDRSLDCDVDPQDSKPLSFDPILIEALREAIGITHPDVPGLEEELNELGESFSDLGFVVSHDAYLKAVELMEVKLNEIDDDEERHLIFDTDLDDFKDLGTSIDWDEVIVIVNT